MNRLRVLEFTFSRITGMTLRCTRTRPLRTRRPKAVRWRRSVSGAHIVRQGNRAERHIIAIDTEAEKVGRGACKPMHWIRKAQPTWMALAEMTRPLFAITKTRCCARCLE